MLAVEFVPSEVHAIIGEGVVNQAAAFAGDVGILTAPEVEHFGFDFAEAAEGVVRQTRAEAALVNIRGITTHSGANARKKGGPGGQMAAEADAYGADFPGAGGVRYQIIDRGGGIGIEDGEGAGNFVGIPPVGPGGIVGKHGAGFLQLVIDYRHGDDKVMPGQ